MLERVHTSSVNPPPTQPLPPSHQWCVNPVFALALSVFAADADRLHISSVRDGAQRPRSKATRKKGGGEGGLDGWSKPRNYGDGGRRLPLPRQSQVPSYCHTSLKERFLSTQVPPSQSCVTVGKRSKNRKIKKKTKQNLQLLNKPAQERKNKMASER